MLLIERRSSPTMECSEHASDTRSAGSDMGPPAEPTAPPSASVVIKARPRNASDRALAPAGAKLVPELVKLRMTVFWTISDWPELLDSDAAGLAAVDV